MPEVLERPPESRTAPLINFVMWKMIVGQAILQAGINLSLLVNIKYGLQLKIAFKSLALLSSVGLRFSGSML